MPTPLPVTVDPSLDLPLVQQIRQQLAWLIASGELSPGDRLPSVRRLAAQLSINVNTVRNAYQKLEADGLVETRKGVGTRVVKRDTDQLIKRSDHWRSYTLGLVLPSVSNPFYHSLIEGVEAATHESPNLLLLCITHDDPAEAQRSMAQLAARQVDGVILASHDPAPFVESTSDAAGHPGYALPMVAVDWPGGKGYGVSLDLEGAGYSVTHHLLSHGHRRLGLITFDVTVPNVRPIYLGYLRALSEAGIEPEPGWVATVGSFESESAADGLSKLLALATPPTAVFAITDLLAIGVLQAAWAAGLRVPGDLALAGFNDIPAASIVRPALTTASAPARELGAEAVRMLQSLIAGQRPARRHLVLPTSLVVRESCGVHPDTSTRQPR